jgi:hypothetical protein
VDNSGDIAGALVTRIPESRWWRDDTSPAGYSSDCSGNSPGVWPAHGLGDLGRFATLLEVVSHYNSFKGLNLTDQEKRDLVEYLKSL